MFVPTWPQAYEFQWAHLTKLFKDIYYTLIVIS